MSKNKENFFIGILSNLILFVVGLIYILVPTYYGIEGMADIDVNDLFLSAMLIIGLLKYMEYFVCGDNPNREAVILCIGVSIVGVINTILATKLNPSFALSISLFIFVFVYSVIKLFTIDYYHDRKNVYYLVQIMFALIILIVGSITSFSMFSDSILETIELGYYIIVLSIIGGFDTTLKALLRSRKVRNDLKKLL